MMVWCFCVGCDVKNKIDLIKNVLDITSDLVYINFGPGHDPDSDSSDNASQDSDNYHDPEDLAGILELVSER